MRHRADELPRSVTRKLRVRIQRNDVLHLRKDRRRGDDERKTLRIAAAQERVQVLELAALAFAAHPFPGVGIPASRPVQQIEHAALGGKARVVGVSLVRFRRALATPVLSIELIDTHRCQAKQRLVLRKRFLVGVRKIGQQSEVQVRVAIGQEPDFKRLDQILDVVSAGEHGWNHHQCPRLRSNSRREIHSR